MNPSPEENVRRDSVANEPVNSTAILIVEDEVLIRFMVADYLRTAGFEVREAVNSEEALHILAAINVAVLVTDIRMPGKIDGVQLAKFVRSRLPETKIIIASAHAPDWPAPGLADSFISKPFEPERLVERIRELLKSTT